MGEIVGAEREELGSLCNAVRGEGRAWQLNHRADGDVQGASFTLRDFLNDSARLISDEVKLHHRADEGHHDLNPRIAAGIQTINHCFSDRAYL